jgi:UTP--glucose-1-phosphate uridylyltransferase
VAVAKKPVRKAVLPAAGFGTRMLPATKAVPKEMFPLLQKPIVQYAVEECHASGIEEAILVTSQGKAAMEAHFREDPELESLLEQRGRSDLAEQVRSLSRLCRLRYAREDSALGLGHAVLCARALVGEEPFAVLLSDVFIDGPRPGTRQLIEAYRKVQTSIVAVERVPRDRVGQCGIVAVESESADSRFFRVSDVVEKPDPERAPSDLGIVGRYVLEPEIFDRLERAAPGQGGEIQLTDALAEVAREGRLWAFVCDGKSFDAGDRAGLLQLTIELTLRDPELGGWLRRYLRSLSLSLEPEI